MTIAKVVLRTSDLPGRFGHAPSNLRRVGAALGAYDDLLSSGRRRQSAEPRCLPAMSGVLGGRRSCGVAVMGEARRGQTNRFARDCWGHYN